MKRDAINFENDKVSVLFRKMLVPTLLGTVCLSAVTAIDGILVGHGVGSGGVAAVNIVVPIYQIMSGFGLMIGAGCSVAASIHQSRQNLRAARLNISQAIILSSLLVLMLTAVVLSFPAQVARMLGASETLMPQVLDYLRWIMPCFMFEMWSMIGLFIIRLDGAPRYAMWCNIIPSLLNAVLDWVFIFPLGMGVKGAAIATAISIALGGIMTLAYLLFFARSLKLMPLKMSRKSMMLAFRNIGYQCRIGSSSLFGELTLAVLIFIGNIVFMEYLGDTGVGAFGIACYYAPFFFMMGNSIAQSAQPIISYNYGISRWKEVREARRLLLLASVVTGVAVTPLFIFIPDKLVALFVDPTGEAGRIAIDGFPYFAAGIVFFILNVAIIGYWQSIERIKKAVLFVFLRGFALLVPCFIILPKLLGTEGIWLAMPLAELTTFILMLAFYRK
ncbi:MAG: polysaccharide biosynthesis C-terminal domain-containing protein [Bacteroidaceae bacterium]|nr:polysaccharide biosynthesis C-terminal domain-containing protein [Bacteroidaceae bacterium]